MIILAIPVDLMTGLLPTILDKIDQRELFLPLAKAKTGTEAGIVFSTEKGSAYCGQKSKSTHKKAGGVFSASKGEGYTGGAKAGGLVICKNQGNGNPGRGTNGVHRSRISTD